MSGNKEIKFTKICKREVFAFDDGDFIVFEIYRHSTLYDKMTLKPKIILDITIRKNFYYFSEDEFGIFTNNKYRVYKFKNNRNEYTEIYVFNLNDYELGKKLMKISNGDILFFKSYIDTIIRRPFISIYKKVKENSNDSDIYQIQEQVISNFEDIIDINNKEILGYKKILSSEKLILAKFNTENYKKEMEKTIKMEADFKKRLYFLTEIYKVENKLICAGCFNIYIIDLEYLELETTIKIARSINTILIRPKGNIFVITEESKEFENELLTTCYYYIQNITIDFRSNDLIENKEIDITEKGGIACSLINIFNYPNNGLITIIDNKLSIYENYNEIKEGNDKN